MWRSDQIRIEIEEIDPPTALARIETPVGTLELIGEITLSTDGREFQIEAAHIQGLAPGTLGRAGLNAIARKLLEESGAETLFIAGSTRTTGAQPGRPPRPFRFPR